MSADLLAEFDSFYQAPTTSKKQEGSGTDDLSFLASPNSNFSNNTIRNGEGLQSQAPGSNQSKDIWNDMAGFQATRTQPSVSTKNDIWGSFEVPVNEKPALESFVNTQPVSGMAVGSTKAMSKPILERRDTLDMFSNNTGNWQYTTSIDTSARQEAIIAESTVAAKSSFGGDILFDADALSEEEEEDDFGDFETGFAANPAPAPIPAQPQSLEGLFAATTIQSKSTKRPIDLTPVTQILESNKLPYPQAPRSPSFQERNPFAELGVHIAKSSSHEQKSDNSPVTAWPTFEPKSFRPSPYDDSPAPADDLDDDWGDFSDLPVKVPAEQPKRPTSGIEADAWAWDRADRVKEKATPRTDVTPPPPPTNIPPPSVLLPLFPPLFDLPQTALFRPVANQTFSLKNRILSDPSTVAFLRAYLLVATVAARVIAGRKLRWKRDTLLSQAMKIGPAAAGGKGGMKLAGVDKAETTREDRESADVVRTWKDQVGRLRSAVAVANSSIQDSSSHLVIPDISESMHVKSQEGGMTAPKSCVVCGLKRDERIAKVDINVEDSFGEWWADHWGHTACRNFWLEHESKLKHR